MDSFTSQTAPSALEALNQWAPILWLKTNAYAYPSLEVLHIVGIALVFGTLWVVDLRIFGALRTLDLRVLARAVLPYTLMGFCLAMFTGLTMFVTRAGDFIANPAFVLKMCLLMAAGVNAAALHARGPLDERSRITQTQALASLAIWLAVITCGRWIAYV